MRRFLTLSLSVVPLLLGGFGWLAFFPALPVDLDGAPNLDDDAAHVRIPVAEADSLDGWLLRGSDPGVIVMFHGYGRTHHRMWRYANFLRPQGYTLLTVDFRSSRHDDRLPTTLGHHERIDAKATLDWLRRQPWAGGHPIGLLGESLGGSVALLVAAETPRVQAIVADCPFATGERAIEDSIERWAHLPRYPAAGLLRWSARLTTGVDPGEIDVLAAAAAMHDRPIFFIHTERDDRLDPQQARDLWAAAGAKDPIWFIQGVGHNEGWQLARDEYEANVSAFFEAHLRPDSVDVLP